MGRVISKPVCSRQHVDEQFSGRSNLFWESIACQKTTSKTDPSTKTIRRLSVEQIEPILSGIRNANPIIAHICFENAKKRLHLLCEADQKEILESGGNIEDSLLRTIKMANEAFDKSELRALLNVSGLSDRVMMELITAFLKDEDEYQLTRLLKRKDISRDVRDHLNRSIIRLMKHILKYYGDESRIYPILNLEEAGQEVREEAKKILGTPLGHDF